MLCLGHLDALVSPGNSYGRMDGGVDRAITEEFSHVQRRVWDVIAERHHSCTHRRCVFTARSSSPS
ncbi:hypothetical protein [Solirubrobacter soli]|uniref:hypothetical protein n=1 Tax=Solirubrobacter soli TaxID=363832 RepID=UPI000429148C|nr:hypothetical protein [Solirubrobacter soli]